MPQPCGQELGGEPPTRPASFMPDLGEVQGSKEHATGMHEHAQDFHAATKYGDSQPSAPMYPQLPESQDMRYPKL